MSPARTITTAERRARLARRHRLRPDLRTDDPVEICENLVALHGSDPASVFLSVLTRMATPSLAAVERALYEDRELVRHHAMRRTIWVATRPTMRRMDAAATRKIALAEQVRTVTLLEANGIEDGAAWLERAKAEALAAVREHGSLSTRQLGRLVPQLAHPLELAPGKSYGGTQGAHARVLLLLGFEGRLVRGRPKSWISGEYVWWLADDWLGEGAGLGGRDPREATAELVDLWLEQFGPATEDDVAWWGGWTRAQTRAALADCAAVPVRLEDGTAAYLARDDRDHEVAGDEPWVALLPSLDPTTMGWKHRSWYLPPECVEAFDGAGNAGPTIWVDGRIVGAWAHAPERGGLVTHLFMDVDPAAREAIAARALEVQSWLGETRLRVRFPGLIQQRLLG